MKRIRRWKKIFTIILTLFLAGGIFYAAKMPVFASGAYLMEVDGIWFLQTDYVNGSTVRCCEYWFELTGLYEVKVHYWDIDINSLERLEFNCVPDRADGVTGFALVPDESYHNCYELVLIKAPEVGAFLPEQSEQKNEEHEEDYLDSLRTLLHIAGEQEGNQTVAYSGDYALPAEFMQYLVDHKNITLIYTVTYDGAEHIITIPAGMAKVEDGVEYYGPAWLIATYGENSAPNPSDTYIVQPGDTLTKIAAILNTTTNDLATKNNIQNQDVIFVGQSILY